MFPSLRTQGNVMSNNVSATMFPRLPGLLHVLHVTLVIEPLVIASDECSVCWIVLPFRERGNFIQLSKNISLYCNYRF